MRIRPLLEKMLQPDPARRPDSMAAIAASLGAAPPGRSARGRGRVADAGSASSPRSRGARWKRAAALLLLIAIVGGGASFYFFALPDEPPTPPIKNGDRSVAAEKISSYIDHYDGGSCFLVTPVPGAITANSAVIEGLGSAAKPFDAFDMEFQHTIGFAASIDVRLVTARQCPAITFLAGLRPQRALAPRLDIDQDSVRNGEVLRGVVDHYGSSNVDLVLVSAAGTVRTLSLKPGTAAKTFEINMPRAEGGTGRQPQLLVAIASPAPIDALKPGPPAEAEAFFQRVLSDAARAGKPLSAAGRYFTLEN
jgi:serine/threonine-protein kinase